MTATTNIETEAFVVDSPNAPFKLTPIILDEMREDEFLIEMKYSGICHTVSGCILTVSGDKSVGTGYRQRRPNLSQSREPS
jgi:Zn-dependent alcohol dehydrogenase